MSGAASLTAALPGCGLFAPKKQPAQRGDTPLAHLYGQDWVRGVYRLYAGGYADLESKSKASSKEAYGIVKKKGIGSLEALQSREVPFLYRAADDGDSYNIVRDVPERLTLTADMSEKERAQAQEAWQKAREHLHTDYAEIRKLNRATSRLFTEHQRLRHSIDAGVQEQFKITRQLGMMRDNARDLPFELPYQVSRDDYGGVLLLLMERLESDKKRIAAVESAITSVGLQVRATDAGSGSLSRNVSPVLLAVAKDAEAAVTPPVDYPVGEDLRRGLARKGKALRALVEETDEYRQWLRVQEQAEEVVVGGLIAVLERVTGLPISAAYREAQAIWRGEGDYLEHLRRLVQLVPGGSKLASAIETGVELTERLRGAYREVREAVAHSDETIKTVRARGTSFLVNAGSRYARDRVGKQLAFLESPSDLRRITSELDSVPWLGGA
jgi:hypothetical protein